jgi:hypothetical protein
MTQRSDNPVFGDDIGAVLDMIRSARPLKEVEAVPCPRCGATLQIWFETDGHGFGVHCVGPEMHVSRRQAIATPPDWWQNRIGDFAPITFYWPSVSEISADGITIRATGYDDEAHWTGVHKVGRDASDYDFWAWVVAQRERWPVFFSDRDLPKLRDEFANAS